MSDFDPIFTLIIVLFSAIIHEVAHGYAALIQGDVTAKYEGRLTLNPIVHLDPIGSIIVPIILSISGLPVFGWAKPIPINPYNMKSKRWGEAIVAFAGPAVNIVIAILFAIVLRIVALPESAVYLISLIILINIVLAVFNLMPIPPLDGSKIVFALVPQKYEYIREYLERYSFLILIIFIFLGWQLITPLVFGLFALISGVSLN